MVSIAIDSETGEKNWCPPVRSVDEVNPGRVTKDGGETIDAGVS